MKNIGTQSFVTENLFLRRFKITDAESMFLNWANDEENCRYLSWPHHPNIDVTVDILSSWISCYDDPSFYQWAITLKNNPDEVIGSISFVNVDVKTKQCEIGYVLGKKYQGKGYMSEVLKILINYAFEEVGFSKVYAETFLENNKSQSLLKKFNFKYVGIVDCNMPLKGITVPCKRFELLK